MIQLIILRNKVKRLPEPQPLPTLTEAESHAYFQGWYAGGILGAVLGLAVGALIAQAV